MAVTSMTPAKAQEIMKRADSAMAKLNKIKGKTEEHVGEVIKMLETVGGGLAVGALRGKYGEVQIGPGIPAEAAIGAVLHLGAFVGLAGKYSEHVHNVGNSVLTTWAALEGIKMAGGTVLSASDVKQLQQQQNAEVQAPAVQASGETQTPRALNGAQRKSAQELLGLTQEQGVGVSTS